VAQPSLSVVIVNWNSREDVLAAARSLAPMLHPGDSLVVVDNGSEDGSVEALTAEPCVQLVATGENLGFAEGVNRGVAAADSDWVLVFNNDAVAQPGFLDHLRAAAADAPSDVGVFQPLLVFAQDPTRVNSTGVLAFSTARARDRDFAAEASEVADAGEPFCATGGAALFRRSMLNELRGRGGYLDRRYFMYFEDVDLGWRARLAGYRTIFLPEAVVTHKFQGSSKRKGSEFVQIQCITNRFVTLLKNGSKRLLVTSGPATIRDLWRLRRFGGTKALLALGRRLPEAIEGRLSLSHEQRGRRKEVEQRWFSGPEQPTPPWPPEPVGPA
jgi:GT2 family glycosyltransferase